MKRTLFILLAIIAFAQISEARQPERGYRGFFEWSNSVRSDNIGVFDIYGNLNIERQGSFYTGFTTSHGYQINPMFFIGAGLGMERCLNENLSNWLIPIFIQGRADLKFGRFTPYADLRLGANVADGAGLYISPTVGYRFNWGRKMGINIGVGLTLSGYKLECYEGNWTGPDSYEIQYKGTKHNIRPYFSFRLGIDF